jgi:hypothetical protein
MTDYSERDKVSAAILCGAELRHSGLDLSDNPFRDMPGSYALHRAWIFGFKNAEQVLREFDSKGDPDYERPPLNWPLR